MKSMMKKIITCTGYHGTGSSIITDYLKEFDEIDSMGNFEFRFIQDPNGIADLEDSLLKNNSRLNSDRAIYEYKKLIKILNSNFTNKFWKKSFYRKIFKDKFLEYSNEYIETLVEVKWNGYWHDIEFREFGYIIRIKKFFYRILELFLKKKIRKKIIYFSYPVEDFYLKTQIYLEKLFEVASDKKILAFDQLVPCCNTERYFNYIPNLKVIIVDRDPRDIYILSKMIWKDGVVPSENVDIFIKHFKLLRKHRKFEVEEKNRILRIKFEDTIYNYDETMKKINSFLNINGMKHSKEKKYFNPQKSMYNTQVFRLYPEYQKDIEKIERELKEYCYNFPYVIDRKEKNRIY